MGPQALLFTIQSLLRLGDVARSSYIDTVRDAAFVLPLLDFSITRDDNGIIDFFSTYQPNDSDPAELKELLIQLDMELNSTQNEVSKSLRDALRTWYKQTDAYRETARQHIIAQTAFKESDVAAETLVNLFSIRQNSLSQSPRLSVLKRMAGTFLEIGVDYFKDVPGSLNIDSREGMALYALFSAMDGVRFSTAEWKQDIQRLPRRLTVSLLETVAEKSDIITVDANVQRLIQQTASGLTQDISRYFTTVDDPQAHTQAISLAETIFRSVIQHAGVAVANDPTTFLDIDNTAKASVVKDISSAIFSLVLDAPGGQLSSAFNRTALDALVKTAIGTVSRYPELLSNSTHPAIQKVISDVSAALLDPSIALTPSLLPDVIRLIIEKSATNIEQLWPDKNTTGKDHLLMLASKTLLSRLAQKPEPGDPWRLRLGRDDLKAVLDTTLEEVAANPAWLVKKAGEDNKYLGAALDSMLTVINTIGAGRINSQNGSRILQAGIRGAALRLEFFNKAQGDQRILERLFQVVLGKLLSEQPEESAAAWQFAKGDMLAQIMEMTIETLTKAEINAASLAQIETVFSNEIIAIQSGKAWDLPAFNQELQQALQVIN